LIDDNGFALWSLSMKKKKTNGLLDLLKKIVIDWWTSETRVSLNKSHVTQRRLEAMVDNEIITNKNECKIYIFRNANKLPKLMHRYTTMMDLSVYQ
jgi:hypothetical protein